MPPTPGTNRCGVAQECRDLDTSHRRNERASIVTAPAKHCRGLLVAHVRGAVATPHMVELGAVQTAQRRVLDAPQKPARALEIPAQRGLELPVNLEVAHGSTLKVSPSTSRVKAPRTMPTENRPSAPTFKASPSLATGTHGVTWPSTRQPRLTLVR